MTMKSQFGKLKENWLLVLLVVIALVFTQVSDSSVMPKAFNSGFGLEADYAMAESMPSRMMYVDDGFAPDVEERKITKTSSLSTEVERGEFHDAQTKLKAIVSATDSFLLNENVDKYDSGRKSYYNGYYLIKVDTSKYDAVVTQLKEIGEITSFNENMQDITGSYTNTQIELDVEKERLARYQQMYSQATKIEDKINLNDRIFDQQRRVKYLEDSLKNMDARVEYTTISVSIREKQSEYANIAFVKFSGLVRSLVSSVNTVVTWLFVLLPYALLVLIGWVVYRKVKK